MCKVYGYVRVSTDTQAEKGYGLEAQRNELEKYAAANSLTITEYFTDAGISGNMKDTDDDDAINKRQALVEMLAQLEAGDMVLVLNTSRLWRSDLTKAIIRREIMQRKAIVKSVEQPAYDLYAVSRDPSAYLTNAIMEALDVYERMSISLKLARGRTTKAKGGDKPAGACPYGYEYAPDKKSIIINAREAEHVKAMFTAAQTGKSLGKIADMLNGQGIVTRQGKTWSRGSVQVILHNRFYVGELSHQGKTINGNHTPIISKIQFGKVEVQLAKRNKHE